MKRFLKRYWFPAAAVLLAAIQTFGMDYVRSAGPAMPEAAPDTVIYDNSKIYTKFRSSGEKVASDSLSGQDFLEEEKETISARDTIRVPDSLKYTDPFRYRYYIALVDSLTHIQVRDSLRAAGDSLDWPKLDSIYFADSAALARKKFEEWYNSLDKTARKRYDYEQKMKEKMRITDSILTVKDSLQAIRDSIRENTPRILETFALPQEKW